jgi:hypothetical protein
LTDAPRIATPYALSRAPAAVGASNATSIATQKIDRFI